ncbi:11-beta-hydroxysteroid dehydrogenase 1A-like [Lycium barbarum]|uniref:11-beta-hydroxysteroid dehydrogenase 1A-like n=1 Tax=Lycium barbarum TaxID=112863 RepID=UPI00293F2C74|nr:11-beta-hydroxysteroid dehydrogenase 1A-like [Lycium barbarum]
MAAKFTAMAALDCLKYCKENQAPKDINFWGSVYPTYFAIPHLKKTRGKVFVNSSSVAILHPPSFSFYTASKAALLSFYETMRLELAPEISITIATLGFTDSEIVRGKHLKDGVMQVDSEQASKFVLLPVISSSDCAKSIVSAICRKDRYVTEPKYLCLLHFAKNVCPQAFEWLHHTFTPEHCTGASQAKKD